MLFAQAVPPPPPAGPPANLDWIIAGTFAFCGLFFLILLVVVVLFLRTLWIALSRCHPDNRTMSPGQVWLNLIPCFNIVWQFVTVLKVGDSLKQEFLDRRLDEGGDYGKTLGLACILLFIGANVVQQVGQEVLGAAGGDRIVAMALVGVSWFMHIGTLALFIIYWVKIAGFSRQLADDDQSFRDDRDLPEDDRDADRRVD
jgi:hypothetical protein